MKALIKITLYGVIALVQDRTIATTFSFGKTLAFIKDGNQLELDKINLDLLNWKEYDYTETEDSVIIKL